MDETRTIFNRTRIAPTPSGFLHLGNILSFAITAGLARQTGAKILLRIDDLDRDRVQREYVQDIFDTLNFLEIPWHEGPRNYTEYEQEWSQMHRMDKYRAALQHLKDQGNLFACVCSRSQLLGLENYPGTCRKAVLDFDAEFTSWRLDTSEKQELEIKTLQHGSIKANLPASMKDFVVRKKDGFPAYQLSSVVDDLFFNVDFIVRGADLWESTLGQHYLSLKLNANAFLNSTFHHHPLLMEQGDKKLSKSAGSTSVKYLREHAKKPADVYKAILEMAGISIGAEIVSWHELVDEVEKAQFNHGGHKGGVKEL